MSEADCAKMLETCHREQQFGLHWLLRKETVRVYYTLQLLFSQQETLNDAKYQARYVLMLDIIVYVMIGT